ncbi:centrosomal protein of 85 kDa-like [Neosynchiropus ocellatus]
MSMCLQSTMSPVHTLGSSSKEDKLIPRWSSLSKLSSGSELSVARTLNSPISQGSLDRSLRRYYSKTSHGLTRDLYSVPNFLCSSLQQQSPHVSIWSSSDSRSQRQVSSALSSPVRFTGQDFSPTSFLESSQAKGVAGVSLSQHPNMESPIKPATRTEMWLMEQMEHSSRVKHGLEFGWSSDAGTRASGGMLWNRHGEKPAFTQMLTGTPPSVNVLKIRERLLRERELEINRQKQKILHLHTRIRENELSAQQVLQTLSTKDVSRETHLYQPSDLLRCDQDSDRKLALAELEVLHLNELCQQVTEKYTADIKKLEEKIQTRDRYVSSMKKKCQRESEQNQEKQRRIETLEKYLADLPTLDEVQVETVQLQEMQHKATDLEAAVSQLQKSLKEGIALLKEKDEKIKKQAKREKELIASVHRLQQRVQECLADGVRMPVSRTQLTEEQDDQCESSLIERPAPSQFHCEMPEVGELLNEMSLCLLDLRALCSILAQRAQGKELNLSLLLGMKSLNISSEESECRDAVEEELNFRLLEVDKLRRDINELRKSVSDCYGCH